MKKIRGIISLALVFALCFSTTAFAAENDFSDEKNELSVTIDTSETVENSTNPTRDPAPAVSSVQAISATIKSDGYVYVTVRVIGYGSNIYSTYDGMQVYVSSSTPLGSPVVYGFDYEVKCAPAAVGNHSFYFRIRSVNSPWNTMDTSETIIVS